MRSDFQVTVEKARKKLANDPARMDRLRVEWNKVSDLLAGYMTGQGLKGYEVR